jgi:two-component system NtrC family sensor kinase
MTNQDDRPAAYDVTDFTLRHITECGMVMRKMNHGAASMEEVAGKVVRYLYDTCIDPQCGGAIP